MPSPIVPADIGSAPLQLTQVAVSRFSRLYRAKHADPLGIGKAPSRFGDPRALPDRKRFGILYLGQTVEVCFLEAILRDQAVGSLHTFLLQEIELAGWALASIDSAQDLRLVDLTGSALVRNRVPTDAVRGSDQTLGRWWSLAFHQHPGEPDGILYPSRLNDEYKNVAVYDRAVPKLRCHDVIKLMSYPGLAAILDRYNLALR